MEKVYITILIFGIFSVIYGKETHSMEEEKDLGKPIFYNPVMRNRLIKERNHNVEREPMFMKVNRRNWEDFFGGTRQRF